MNALAKSALALYVNQEDVGPDLAAQVVARCLEDDPFFRSQVRTACEGMDFQASVSVQLDVNRALAQQTLRRLESSEGLQP